MKHKLCQCGTSVDLNSKPWGLCRTCHKLYCGTCVKAGEQCCGQSVVMSECCACHDTYAFYDWVESPDNREELPLCPSCGRAMCGECLRYNGMCPDCKKTAEEESNVQRRAEVLRLETMINAAHGCVIDHLPRSASIHDIFYLPTEFIVSEPKHCTPDVGRIYVVDVRSRRDSPKQLKNVSVAIHLHEVWENIGEDGHVEYRFMNQYALIDPRKRDCKPEDGIIAPELQTALE